MNPAAPLILTLGLDAAAQARLDALRAAHFPPERNFIAAHLTLFHHLPGDEIAAVARVLSAEAGMTAPFPLVLAHPRSIGRGVALFAADCPPLAALRRRLAAAFAPRLTPQDRQGFRPHVTVQNKVDPKTAKELLVEMQAAFAPVKAEAVGLRLWHYRGGPWESAGSFAFEAFLAARHCR